MKKRAVMHREHLNVVVRGAKADFSDQLIKEGMSTFLPAFTLHSATIKTVFPDNIVTLIPKFTLHSATIKT